jgi:Zn-dependent protease with chaperone function
MLGSVAQVLLQPYVYYAAVLTTVWFLCAKLLLRLGSFLSRRVRSMLLMVPLAVPAIALVATYAIGYFQSLYAMRGLGESAPFVDSFTASPASYFVHVQPPPPSLYISPSTLTTLLGVAALSAGGIVFVSMLFLGGRISRRAFGVVAMEEEDYPEVQERVRFISFRIGIAAPKVGLVEDLRPNAFSVGSGGDATIVFSLGILNILGGDELDAVISHELAHIRNGDSTFKALMNALITISFFNPLAYISASAALREREMLADEKGASVLSHPHALASALVKVGNSLRAFPPERHLMRLAAATFLVSSFEHRSAATSVHPLIKTRAWNVLGLESRSAPSNRRLAAVLVVSSLVLLGGVVASFYLVNVQAQMLQVYLPKAPLAFSYASYHGFGGVDVQVVHFVGFAHPPGLRPLASVGGDLGLRTAHLYRCHPSGTISHI